MNKATFIAVFMLIVFFLYWCIASAVAYGLWCLSAMAFGHFTLNCFQAGVLGVIVIVLRLLLKS